MKRIITLAVVATASLSACAVEVKHGQPVPNVVPPNTLTVIFDRSTEGKDWGSDASVRKAEAECLDMGGTPVWMQDPYRLECTKVDF